MRKRSKYRPKDVRLDTIGYVMESIKPVAAHESYLLDLKIKNSEAMVALMHGHATKADIDILIAMSNVTEALHRLGFGKEYQDVCIGGRVAILKIVERLGKHHKFTPTGPEIQLLNALMELHDAQMDVITIKDMEKALAMVQHEIRYNKDTIRLPKIPEDVK